ncbi:MAG: C40 family peptidase [Elusimicrobiota bacterium]
MRSALSLTAALFFLAAAPAGAKSIAEARDEVVRETMRYLNVPYLWGGMHPDTGIDCSAFVQLVYHKADLRVPRVARDQYAASAYLEPEEVLPGDLLFFSMKRPGGSRPDHVGVYVGKGFFVHASVTNGIHIDSVSNPYYFQRLISARKYRGF